LSYSPVPFHCSFEAPQADAGVSRIAPAKASSAASSAVAASFADPAHPVR